MISEWYSSLNVQDMRRNYERMPSLLKFLTVQAIVLFIFFPASLWGFFTVHTDVFPAWDWWVNTLIPGHDRGGIALLWIFVSDETFKGKMDISQRNRFFGIGSTLLPAWHPYTLSNLMFSIIYFLLLAWYLFRKRTVIEYFSVDNAQLNN